MAIDNRLQVFNEEGQPVDYDILANDVKFLPDGKDLPTKLAEMEEKIDHAVSGDGTVTGVKVGNTPYSPDGEGVVDLSTPFNAKVDKVNGYGLSKNDYTDNDKTKLDNLPTADQLTTQLGNKANSSEVVKSISVNGQTQTMNNGNVNIEVQAGGESIVFDTEGTPIIDSPLSANANTVLGAASARWVKEIDNNVKAILAALAGIAFTDTKPNWQAVAKRKYNLTMTALTGCTGEVVSGDAGNGQVYEGGVRIKLTPTTAYTFASIKVNGEDAASTPTGDSDNSVYIDIIANQDITVTATAVSGFAIAVSGSHVTNTQSHIGSTYTVTLGSDNQHFHLPDTITVKHGQTVLTVNTHYSYNKNTGEVEIYNVNDGTYSIEVTMVEDAKYNVTLDATGLTGATAVLSAAQVYAGESATITVTPNEGYALNSVKYAINSGSQQDATISNNQAVITLSNITENKSVVVTGSASIPTELSLNLKWFEEPSAEDKVITEGQPFSLELTPLFKGEAYEFIAAATQDKSNDGTTTLDTPKEVHAVVQVINNGIDITANTGVVDFDTTNNKVTITIANPSGRVEINATARLKIRRKFSYNGNADQIGNADFCIVRSYVPVPEDCKPVKTVYIGYGTNGPSALSIFRKSDGTKCDDAGCQQGVGGVRTYTNALLAQMAFAQLCVGFAYAAGTSEFGDNPESPIPCFSAKSTASDAEIVPIVTKDDFRNAYYYD